MLNHIFTMCIFIEKCVFTQFLPMFFSYKKRKLYRDSCHYKNMFAERYFFQNLYSNVISFTTEM